MRRLIVYLAVWGMCLSLICVGVVMVIGRESTTWETAYAHANDVGWTVYRHDINRQLATILYRDTARNPVAQSVTNQASIVANFAPDSLSPDYRYLVRQVVTAGSSRTLFYDLVTGEGIMTGLIPVLAWSPDEGRYAFQSNGSIYINTVEALRDNIRGDLISGDVMARAPQWSPDGTQVAFVGHLPMTGATPIFDESLYVVNADGSDLRVIADEFPVADATVTWSADNLSVLFLTQEANRRGWTVMRAYVNNGDVQPLFLVTFLDSSPLLSPDGRFIAYREANAPVSGLFIYDVNAGNIVATPLVHDVISMPMWSPDGARLLYMGLDFQQRMIGERFLYTVAVDGGDAQRLVFDEVIWLR